MHLSLWYIVLVFHQNDFVKDIVVIYGEDVCCSVVFGTLVGVSVFSVIWSELLITSAIRCPLWMASAISCPLCADICYLLSSVINHS